MFPIPDPKGSCCGRATERVQGAVMGGLGSFLPSPPWQSVIKGMASCSCKRHAPSLNRALSELFGLLLLPHKATEKSGTWRSSPKFRIKELELGSPHCKGPSLRGKGHSSHPRVNCLRRGVFKLKPPPGNFQEV